MYLKLTYADFLRNFKGYNYNMKLIPDPDAGRMLEGTYYNGYTRQIYEIPSQDITVEIVEEDEHVPSAKHVQDIKNALNCLVTTETITIPCSYFPEAVKTAKKFSSYNPRVETTPNAEWQVVIHGIQ